MKKTETVYQTRTMPTNARVGTLFGVRLTTSSSTASKKEMMMTRTLTSHASHARSLKLVSLISAANRRSKRPDQASRVRPGVDGTYPESFAIIVNSGRYRDRKSVV